MKRIEVKTREELFFTLKQLEEEQADIISVEKYAGKYIIKSRTQEDAERDTMKEDYERLLYMEKRIKVYPELLRAVRAAINHDDVEVDNRLIRHYLALQETPPPCQSEQDSRHNLP